MFLALSSFTVGLLSCLNIPWITSCVVMMTFGTCCSCCMLLTLSPPHVRVKLSSTFCLLGVWLPPSGRFFICCHTLIQHKDHSVAPSSLAIVSSSSINFLSKLCNSSAGNCGLQKVSSLVGSHWAIETDHWSADFNHSTQNKMNNFCFIIEVRLCLMSGLNIVSLVR